MQLRKYANPPSIYILIYLDDEAFVYEKLDY